MAETDIINTTPPQLQTLDSLTKTLDNRFTIPGTNIKFGLDFLIGLVPYAGDMVSFLMSSALVLVMVRHGASGILVTKMLGNIFLDTTVGSIPILGDLFDLGYKSNRRNYHLLEEHYEEGKHNGSIWPILIGVLIALIAMFVLLIWIIYKIIAVTWDLIF
ncbi:MAG: hypothetical protein ACI9XO_001347 [Paraglaciecola sp.]|jgi:hypothetical protein